MTEKSAIRCTTPRCVSDIAAYGERYHSVHPVKPGQAPATAAGATAKCDHCGGFHLADGTWKHVCKSCGTDVQPGELRGYYVPHRCQACDDKLVAAQHARGDVCRRCHTVTAYCCC